MKFIYSVLLVFAFFCTLNGQNDHQNFLPKNIIKSQPKTVLEWVVDSIYCFRFNEDAGQIIEDTRTYNLGFTENGQIQLELTEIFENGVWRKNRLFSTAYTSTFNPEVELFQNWDITIGDWVNDRRVTYGYNANDLLNEIVVELYDSSTNTWSNSSRNTFRYLNLTEPDEFIAQQWTNDRWENLFQIFFSYNTNMQVTSSFFRNWDNNRQDWVNGNQTFETYDANNNLVQTLRETWSEARQEWDNSTRTALTYQSDGNLDRLLNEIWINQDSTWGATDDNLYGYDFRGRNNEFIIRNFDNDDFQNFFRNKRTFDNFDNLVLAENQFFQSGFWVNNGYCELFYTQIDVSSTENTVIAGNSKLKRISNGYFIFDEENRAQETLFIKAFDLSGKLVHFQKIYPNTPFRLNLSEGLKVLSIYSEKGLIAVKKEVFHRN